MSQVEFGLYCNGSSAAYKPNRTNALRLSLLVGHFWFSVGEYLNRLVYDCVLSCAVKLPTSEFRQFCRQYQAPETNSKYQVHLLLIIIIINW